mmetsp:Transcript_13786/g.41975  ORF Transcript_13786/g.41975 Transcript_13786/m.41975 type:complete len:95 (-) Transcript_13786:425-709(-)
MADAAAIGSLTAGNRGVTLTTAAIKRMMLAERASQEMEKADDEVEEKGEGEGPQKPAREFEVGERRQPGTHMTRTELQNIKAVAAAMEGPAGAP